MKPWRAVNVATTKKSQNLCSKAITPKYYYSLLKILLNDMPPIIHGNKFVIYFSQKSQSLSFYF